MEFLFRTRRKVSRRVESFPSNGRNSDWILRRTDRASATRCPSGGVGIDGGVRDVHGNDKKKDDLVDRKDDTVEGWDRLGRGQIGY